MTNEKKELVTNSHWSKFTKKKFTLQAAPVPSSKISASSQEKRFVCACGRGYTRPDRYRKHLELCMHQNKEIAVEEEEGLGH